MSGTRMWPEVRSNAAVVAQETPWLTMVHNWSRYRPPSRPSAWDVRNFEARVRACLDGLGGAGRGRDARVLVLGATPELRSLLAQTPGVRVTLVDYMVDMILAMTELMTVANPDETWVKGDWTEAPLQAGGFDIVLSDLILANLPLDKQDAVVAKVAELLAPEGVWVNRVDCVDEHTWFWDLPDVLARYADTRVDDVTPELVAVARNQAGIRHWDPETRFMSWSELGAQMERYLVDGRFRVAGEPALERLLHEIWDITVPFDKVYWLRPRDELEAVFAERFDIANRIWDSHHGQNHERGYYLYDLRPRARAGQGL